MPDATLGAQAYTVGLVNVFVRVCFLHHLSPVCWLGLSQEDLASRHPSYRFVVGFHNQVKLYTLEWDIRNLAYRSSSEPFSVPGAGRGAGYLRKYTASCMSRNSRF